LKDEIKDISNFIDKEKEAIYKAKIESDPGYHDMTKLDTKIFRFEDSLISLFPEELKKSKHIDDLMIYDVHKIHRVHDKKLQEIVKDKVYKSLEKMEHEKVNDIIKERIKLNLIMHKTYHGAPVKEFERIYEKYREKEIQLRKNGNNDMAYGYIKDMSRGSVMLDSASELLDFLKYFEELIEKDPDLDIVEKKNMWEMDFLLPEKKDYSYKDIKLIMKSKKYNLIFELQCILKDVMEMKKKDHLIYDLSRIDSNLIDDINVEMFELENKNHSRTIEFLYELIKYNTKNSNMTKIEKYNEELIQLVKQDVEPIHHFKIFDHQYYETNDVNVGHWSIIKKLAEELFDIKMYNQAIYNYEEYLANTKDNYTN